MPATTQVTTLHPVSKLAEQYRTALLKRERAASLDLLTRYGHAWQRTHTLSQALIAEIEAKRLAGLKITNGAVQQNQRYKDLLAQLEDEMRRLTPYTEMVVRGGQYAAIAAADTEAPALARAGIAGLPEPAKDPLFSGWNRLPTDAAESLVGTLQDGSPLSTLLQPLGAQTVKGIGDALTTGIVLGHNPAKIAQDLRDAFGLTTTRSLRIARTEVLRAYRTAHIMSYRENPQIVKGWRWAASKSLRTCICCIWLDGTIHTLDEFFPGHVNCRCAPVPITPTWAELGIKGMTDLPAPATGQAWFMGLGKPEQEQILGSAMFRAWDAGAIQPADFWRWDHDPTWGTAPQVNSLKGVLGEGAAEFYG